MSSNYTSISNQLRRRILELTHANKASHIGGAFSIIDILTVLYNKILKYDANNGTRVERDRLFYSKGHACTALYSVLEQVGFYSKTDLDRLCLKIKQKDEGNF